MAARAHHTKLSTARVEKLTQRARRLIRASPKKAATRPAQEGARAGNNLTGWATLRPYTDEDGVTPLRSTKGNNKGLILYDAKWQPAISVPWIAAAMTPATQSVKNDTALGADVTPGRASLSDFDLTGKIWYRNDGVTSVAQSPGATVTEQDLANPNFALSNITPNFNGYSLTSSNSNSGDQFNIDLKFKNWYLRWLGLFIQFYDSKGIVDASLLPPDISKFLGYIGYGWESYNTQGCVSGAGQFDQLANIANANGPGGNAQTGVMRQAPALYRVRPSLFTIRWVGQTSIFISTPPTTSICSGRCSLIRRRLQIRAHNSREANSTLARMTYCCILQEP
jgi:hypothetical protein